MSGGTGRRFAVGPALPLLPFLLFVLVFLVVPTLTVVLGAFQDEDGRPTLGNLDALRSEAALTALRGSLILSASTALIGAVLGAVLAYLIVSLPAHNLLRRSSLAISGVLAQFGGVDARLRVDRDHRPGRRRHPGDVRLLRGSTSTAAAGCSACPAWSSSIPTSRSR